MNADGSNQTRLTNIVENEHYAAWSPDGTKIAFSSDQEGCCLGSDIYTMNADGTNQTNITNSSAFDESADWQPIIATTNTAPTIISLRPAPGSSTTDRTPTIAATVTDEQTNLAKSNITLVLDGGTIPRTSYS